MGPRTRVWLEQRRCLVILPDEVLCHVPFHKKHIPLETALAIRLNDLHLAAGFIKDPGRPTLTFRRLQVHAWRK